MEGKVRAGRGKGANQISRLSCTLVDPMVPPCGGSRWLDRAQRSPPTPGVEKGEVGGFVASGEEVCEKS